METGRDGAGLRGEGMWRPRSSFAAGGEMRPLSESMPGGMSCPVLHTSARSLPNARGRGRILLCDSSGDLRRAHRLSSQGALCLDYRAGIGIGWRSRVEFPTAAARSLAQFGEVD